MSGPASGLVIELGPSRISYRLGTAEPELQAFLAAHLSPGDTFYDVGANVGFFSLVGASAVGATGQVLAFEPVPANAEFLRRNVELNQLDYVEVIEAAVADTDGVANLDPGSNDQSGALRADGTVPVRVVTIDGHVRNGASPPNLMKIDVEGAEESALLGAAHTLATHAPRIVCEIHAVGPRIGDHPVAQFLAEFGYALSWLEQGVETNPTFWAPHLVALPRGSDMG